MAELVNSKGVVSWETLTKNAETIKTDKLIAEGVLAQLFDSLVLVILGKYVVILGVLFNAVILCK
jgi:hypothetical protein